MKKIGHMVENYIMVSFHKNIICIKSIYFNDIYLVGFLWSRDLCLDKFYFNVLFQWRCLNSPLVLNLSDIYFRSSSNLISPVWLWLFSAAFPCFLMRNLFLLVYQWVSHIFLRKFYSPKNPKFRFWSFQSFPWRLLRGRNFAYLLWFYILKYLLKTPLEGFEY